MAVIKDPFGEHFRDSTQFALCNHVTRIIEYSIYSDQQVLCFPYTGMDDPLNHTGVGHDPKVVA